MVYASDQNEHCHMHHSMLQQWCNAQRGSEGLKKLSGLKMTQMRLLEPVCRLKECLLLGVMGGGPGEEEVLEEEEGGPGDTERRRSPPIWLRTWLLGLWGRRGLI